VPVNRFPQICFNGIHHRVQYQPAAVRHPVDGAPFSPRDYRKMLIPPKK
jgi:hypothetical protein